MIVINRQFMTLFIKIWGDLTSEEGGQRLKYSFGFSASMEKTPSRRSGAGNFVDSMLQSAREIKEVQPQTRYDNVDQAQLDKVMANFKKGVVRRL